jgi:ribosomal-protein-alanine N-acetyltransferase
MREADLEAVLAVERLCHSHPWSERQLRQELENPLARVELLWLGEELAGFLCCWLVADELHIQNVATAPACRRRGVAAALLRRAFEQARRQGCTRALLEVRVGNAGAIALYRRFGFRDLDLRRRYYPDGEDALVMEHALRH